MEEGFVLVNADAAGIQLRNLAHYMNDDNFTNSLINGVKWESDAHSLACKAAGLIPKNVYTIDGRQGTGRDVGKTINYSLVFRAGDDKMGRIIGGSADDGKRLKKELKKIMPQYDKIVEASEKAFNARGYVLGLDGRRIYPPGAYQALNYLIQGAEAVCFKVALCKLHQRLTHSKIEYKQVGWHHDEVSIECREEHADFVIKSFDESLQWAARYLKHRCPLAGEGHYGKDWAIH